MKRALIVSAVLGLAVAPLALAAAPAKAEGLGLFQSGAHGKSQRYSRGKRVRPEVRGFVFRPGGFSYRIPDTYHYDAYKAEPPSDFGPYLDYGPSPMGIIPNDPYH